MNLNNLIGGTNNIGKTVLLEALLLHSAPTAQNVNLLKRLRGFDTEHDKEFPEYILNAGTNLIFLFLGFVK